MKAAAVMVLAVLFSGCAPFAVQDRAGVGRAPGDPPLPIAPVELAKPELPEPVEPAPAWTRPAGPLRVALQAGHWRSAEAPAEQAQLRVNGTRAAGIAEWEVNLGIARRAAELLRAYGYQVEVLPTTIPPGYWADLFIAIHADGSPSPRTSGYRAAAPRRDETGKANEFAALLERSYGEATGLPFYPLVTRRMTGYYAFNHRAYEHALHPMTVGVILETGFLSSPSDRKVIVSGQDRAARGIVEAVNRYFEPKPGEPRLASAE
jgi:N-acetylmuramoyl-L-alanine amidase